MQIGDRELVVVGDRVLVQPEEGDSVTTAGLILPASVADRDSVQSGRVVALGPGFAVASGMLDVDEDWKRGRAEARYVAMQAKVGDLAVFYRKAAVEITVNQQKFLVVSHSAILVLLRGDVPREGAPTH